MTAMIEGLLQPGLGHSCIGDSTSDLGNAHPNRRRGMESAAGTTGQWGLGTKGNSEGDIETEAKLAVDAAVILGILQAVHEVDRL